MLLGDSQSSLAPAAECVIFAGTPGQEISDVYPSLVEVTVNSHREQAAVATMRFESFRDETGHVAVLDNDAIVRWAPIMIKAAFGDREEEVMRGFIREIRAEFSETPGACECTVECQDESLALDREHIRRGWGGDTPLSDGMILSEIVLGHNLVPHSENEEGLTEPSLLQNSTDICFLRSRAEANGFELRFREGDVYFGPMRVEADSQPTIMVHAGQSSHCFRFSLQDDGHKPDQVAYEMANSTGSEGSRTVVDPNLEPLGPEPTGSGSAGLKDFVWNMSRTGGAREEEIAARAQQKANENSMKVKAEGELDGSSYGHVLRAGEPVDVDGVGERFSGTYYVDSVQHRFSQEGYRQVFTLLRNAYGERFAPAVSWVG